MRNAGPDEAQAGIKIAERNINNFRYADEKPLWQNQTIHVQIPTLTLTSCATSRKFLN